MLGDSSFTLAYCCYRDPGPLAAGRLGVPCHTTRILATGRVPGHGPRPAQGLAAGSALTRKQYHDHDHDHDDPSHHHDDEIIMVTRIIMMAGPVPPP